MAVHHDVNVLTLDAVDVADLHRLKRTALDPVADRLRGELKFGGDLLDGEEPLVSHGKHPRRPDTNGTIARREERSAAGRSYHSLRMAHDVKRELKRSGRRSGQTRVSSKHQVTIPRQAF